MLAQTLIQLAAALPVIWPGHAAAPQAIQSLNRPMSVSQEPVMNSPPLSPAEFEQICKIRQTISSQHRPLADSHFLGGDSTEFRTHLFSQHPRDAPPIEPASVSPPEQTGELQTRELRQVGEKFGCSRQSA